MKYPPLCATLLALALASPVAAADYYEVVPYSLAQELEDDIGPALRTALGTTTSSLDGNGNSNNAGYWIHQTRMSGDGWIAITISDDDNWDAPDRIAMRNPSTGAWAIVPLPTWPTGYSADGWDLRLAHGGHLYANVWSDDGVDGSPRSYRYASGAWSEVLVSGKVVSANVAEWASPRLAVFVCDSATDITAGTTIGTLDAETGTGFVDLTSKIPAAADSFRFLESISDDFCLGGSYNSVTEVFTFYVGLTTDATWTVVSQPAMPAGFDAVNAEFWSEAAYDSGGIYKWSDYGSDYKSVVYRVNSSGAAAQMVPPDLYNGSTTTSSSTLTESYINAVGADGTAVGGASGGNSSFGAAVIYAGTATSGRQVIWNTSSYAWSAYGASRGWGLAADGTLGLGGWLSWNGSSFTGFELGVPVASLASISLTSTGTTLSEGGSSETLTVTRTGTTLFPLRVNLSFATGDLAVGGDSDGAVTVTIPAGQSSSTVTLSAVNDSAIEGDEIIALNVAAGDGVTADKSYSSSASLNITVQSDDVGVVPTITGTATVNAPQTITITFNEAVTGFELGDIVVGNGTASSLSGSGASYTCLITPSAEGSVTISIDAAAATGSSGSSLAATPFSFTYDSTAPAAPSLALDAASNSGSTADLITNDPTPTITGTAEANATVNLQVGGTALGSTTANGSGSWSYTTGSLGGDGTYEFTATATDGAGNTSSVSSSLTLTLDTTASAAPTLTLAPASNSGSTADLITNDSTPTITGTAEANATVNLLVGGTALGSTTADGSGSWSYTTGNLGSDGDYVLSATISDVAGNTASSNTLAVTLDTTAPTVALSNDGSEVTGPFDLTATFSEAVVNVDSTDFSATGATVTGTATSSSVYTLAVTPTTEAISVSLTTADITDLAGNALAAGDSAAITARVALAITTSSAATDDASVTVTFTFGSDIGSSFDESDITVENGTLSNFSEVTAGTVYTVTVTPVADGPVVVSVAASSATNGSLGNQAASATVTPDGTPDNTGPVYAGMQVTITGNVANATTVRILDPDSVPLATGSTDSAGAFSLQIALPSTATTLTIEASDGTTTTTRSIRITPNLDTTPPSNG